jgi:MoaA/NifB/PqqE/SkfB family radical SAM enzyme
MKQLISRANKLSQAVSQLPIIDRIARPIWCAFTSRLPLDLTYSDVTHWISMELTSRCNLRCVYCPKSWDKKEGKRVFDFPEELIAPSMKTLRQRGLWGVIASGIGESTLRKGWQGICRTFHDAGLNLTIISNFSRPMNDEDLDALIRFNFIQVSIDTADPELFARLRRGGRVENLVMNIDKVRDYAKSKGVRTPDFRFDMVIADKTLLGIEDVIRLGLKHGVSDFYLPT